MITQCFRRCRSSDGQGTGDKLLLHTAVAVVAGLVFGIILAVVGVPEWLNILLGMPGRVFLRLLKLLVIPLVTASLAGSVMHLRRVSSGGGLAALSRKVLGVYSGTYALALITGMVLVNAIEPGKGGIPSNNASDANVSWQCEPADTSTLEEAKNQKSRPLDPLVRLVDGLTPTNFFAAAAENNILGLVVVACVLGVVLPVGQGRQPLSGGERMVTGVNDVVGVLVGGLLRVSPVGVCSLIVAQLTSVCEPSKALSALGGFVLTVTLGLLIHGLVWLPALYAAVTRTSPLRFFKNFGRAHLTALSLASSAATLPVNVQCAEQHGISHDLASFVLCLGATANMDGTAMYEATACIFIAQMRGVGLGFADQLIVAFTASLAAVGAAAIPNAGLITLIAVLQAAGLQEYTDDITYILVVDWLLDRFRTTVNVIGDGVALCVVERWGQEGHAPAPHSEFEASLCEELSPNAQAGHRDAILDVGVRIGYDTSEGRAFGGRIKGLEEGDTYVVEEPDGTLLRGWRADWLYLEPVRTVDPVVPMAAGPVESVPLTSGPLAETATDV